MQVHQVCKVEGIFRFNPYHQSHSDIDWRQSGLDMSCHLIPISLRLSGLDFKIKFQKKPGENKIFADDVCLRAKRWLISWFRWFALVTASGTFAGFFGGAGGASLFSGTRIGSADFFRLNVVLHGYFLSSFVYF